MAISSCLSILPLGANQDAPVAGVEAPRALPSRVAAFAAQGARLVKTGVDVSASAAALAAKLCVIPSLGFAIATWFDYFARNNGFHERSLLPSQQFLSCAKQLTAVGLPLLGFELPENSREMSNASAPASSLTLPKCSSEVIDETIELNKWAMRNRAEQRELIDLHRAGLVLGTAALASLCVVTLDLIKSVLRKRAERSLPGAASHDLASGGTPTFLQDLKNTIDLKQRLEKCSWAAAIATLASLIVAGVGGAVSALSTVAIGRYTSSSLSPPPYCSLLAAGIPAHDHRLEGYTFYSPTECRDFKATLLSLSSYSSAIAVGLASKRFSEIWAFTGLLALGVAMGPSLVEEMASKTSRTFSRLKRRVVDHFHQSRQVAAINTHSVPAGV